MLVIFSGFFGVEVMNINNILAKLKDIALSLFIAILKIGSVAVKPVFG